MRGSFVLTFVPLIALAAFGILIESKAQDLSDVRAWIGPVVVIAAVLGLMVAFRRDLFPTAKEKRVQWERLKSKGRLRYVTRQVLVNTLAWVPLILSDFIIRRRSGWAGVSVSWQFVLFAIVLSIAWSLISWRHLDRKYANLSSSGAT